ncbi:MAG TPA: CARDB domain-containing protein, partial [Thermoplasmata archaeon]|nr:CARDB domain-containing protein [Thermoplasmata archaeon]
MSNRTGWQERTLRMLVLLVLGPTGFLAAIVALPMPAHAGPCDQVSGVITGDWTISNAQICSGIFYTVDGSININSGGSLTLIDGGLKFAKDATHQGYALNVNAGGELVLDDSTVTTQTGAIQPILKLALTVSGGGARLTMRNGAMLKFPGWFNSTGGTIEASDSTITGFTATEVLGVGVWQDDNDDGPVIDWASTSASLYRSRVERIYENTSAASDPNATGVISGNLGLRAGSNLYAYDSYIGADFSNIRGLHNELRVDGTSNAYLYAVTIDRTQDPVSRTDWRSAYVPTAVGGSVYLLRWLHVTAVDSTSFPVSGTTVVSTLSPSAALAQFPDNGFSTTPSTRTLTYLGRTASGVNAWDVTDATGTAHLPLYTDQITTATLPNAESFGNYHEDLTFGTSTAQGGVNFDAYPAIAQADNNQFLTVPFPNLSVRTVADLLLRPADYGTIDVIQGQSFNTFAAIYNQGQTTAVGFSVGAYLDGNLNNEVGRVDGLTVAVFLNQTVTVTGVGTLGAHTLMLFVDSGRDIDEGGAAQENNNFANITLNVLPPPNGFVAILSPTPGQAIEPGATLSVTGYLRDENGTGIVGVPLLIELRSGSTVIASNTSQSGAGGFFIGTLRVPAGQADGSYTVVVTPTSGPITPDTQAITIRRSVSFFNQSLLGLPMWIWLLIVLGAAAAIVGGTAYVKFVGLGKLVECGECGSYIASDSPKCPKCGVEFEKGMAKCSNCQTWIPVDVKECPECGVEFATGEVEMADYEAQMRRQYDDVKRRFREDASREFGRSLSDREFADWW